MRQNADLTIYAKGYNSSTHAETWTRSVVYGVTWEDRRAGAASREGVQKSDTVTVYIDASRKASVKVEDVIVRGVVTDAIGPSFTVSALKAKYPNDSATVRAVDSFDIGSPNMRHLRIGAN